MTKVATRVISIWLYLELINTKERQGTDPLLTTTNSAHDKMSSKQIEREAERSSYCGRGGGGVGRQWW